MARQTWDDLAALYPDNTAGAISPADLRAGMIDSERPHEAAGDPDTSDDETSGFDVGHKWLNTSDGSIWECRNASTGSADWVKVYPQGAGGVEALDDLSDVDTSGAEDGDNLTYQSGVWVAAEPAGGGAEALDDLSDVDTSGASDNDLFGLQSSVWGPIANTSDFATAAQGTKADAALPKLATVNSYAGNRTLDGDDSGAYIRITAAGTVTLPDGRATGYQCVIVNATDSDTVALSAATTLTIPSGFEAEVQNRKAVTVIHVGSNVWEAHGALVEST